MRAPIVEYAIDDAPADSPTDSPAGAETTVPAPPSADEHAFEAREAAEELVARRPGHDRTEPVRARDLRRYRREHRWRRTTIYVMGRSRPNERSPADRRGGGMERGVRGTPETCDSSSLRCCACWSVLVWRCLRRSTKHRSLRARPRTPARRSPTPRPPRPRPRRLRRSRAWSRRRQRPPARSPPVGTRGVRAGPFLGHGSALSPGLELPTASLSPAGSCSRRSGCPWRLLGGARSSCRSASPALRSCVRPR